MKRMVVGLVVLTLVSNSLSVMAQTTKQDKVQTKQYVVLTDIKNSNLLKKEVDVDSMESSVVYDENTYISSISATGEQIDKISKNKNIIVSEDTLLNASSVPEEDEQEVESTNAEWNLKMINAEQGAPSGIDNKIKVAILDSGIDCTDEIDVKERINLIPEEKGVFTPFEDTSGHGTSIAGIIAAKDNGKGITGINPNVELYSARMLDDKNQAPISRVIEGIYWAIEKNVKIISMSFGTNQDSEVLHKAVRDADEAGILVIASAGNNGGAIEYPAAYEEVMAVGSVDTEGNLSDTSSRGEELEIVAPGEHVKTTGSFGGGLVTSGTSIAVPHVVGVASILWEKDADCSNEFIRNLLVVSSNKSTDVAEYESGIVDLEYALSIYDDYKKNYNSNVMPEEYIEENNNTLYTENEATVNARWNLDGHVSLAGKAGTRHSLSATQTAILKLGIKYPDQKFSTMTNNPQWHTATVSNYDNYISNYRCASLIALALKKGKSASSVSKPNDMLSANYTKMVNQVGGISWGSALQGYTVNASNKGLFTMGMAMHIITDTYAHQSYVKVNGKWKHLNHDDDNCDSTSVCPKRFTLAGEAACDALQTYLDGDAGDHWEFVQAYDGTSFRLKRLVQYATQQDTYNASTFGELNTLKKGDVAYD